MFQNLDLFAVGLSTAAIGILGFLVFFNNRRGITHRSFLFFSLATIFYSVCNYLVYQLQDPRTVLWLLRLSVFFVVWHAFGIFQVFFVFPKNDFVFPRWYKKVLVPVVVLTALATLTPLVFMKVAGFDPHGHVSRVINGPAIPLFGVVVTLLVLGGILVFLRKFRHTSGLERVQFRFLLIGALITFPLYIFFNFMLPALYDNSSFIPLAPVFSLPLVIFTAYAIVKYRLLNVKIIATQFLAFLLIISSFFEIILSRGWTEIIFRSGVFAALFLVGVLLIQSVMREVEQREKLEALGKELAQANQELKKLDQAKSEFISIASHQLRAPMTVIRGYISMIMEGSIGRVEEKTREALTKVTIATDHLIKLISDLLDLSRIESGKIQYVFAPHDMVNVVEEVVREFKEIADKKGVVFKFQNKVGDVLTFSFDKDKIHEVVLNLVDNAIKYSKKSGQVLVDLGWVNGSATKRVRFSVKDDGIGVDEEDKKKLFSKFARSEDARLVDPGGMGIGLYFVRRVVEDHGGIAGVESEGRGKGSTFFVELSTNK